MNSTYKPVPTEYTSTRSGTTKYRSKTEALFARWLDTRVLTIKYWYEPKAYRIEDWTPDFSVLIDPHEDCECFSEWVIEVKPKTPTDTYFDLLGFRFDQITPRCGEHALKMLFVVDPWGSDSINTWSRESGVWYEHWEFSPAGFELDYRFDLAS